MQPRCWIAAFVLSFILAGCSTGEFRGRSDAPTYPPYKGNVRVLERLPQAGTYERLGIVMARAGTVSYGDTLIKRLKKTAATRGANAIVLQGQERDTIDGTMLAGWAIRVRAP